ncbi:MAG: ATP synthase subunit I [Betaproteobacteria bacterium]|nr:ATP synthase subunit I [Betaproteobacteria bacterium]
MRLLLRLQVAATLILTAAAAVVGDRQDALSSLIGGSIGFAGSLVYAVVALSVRTNDPQQAWRAQVLAEACKYAVTILAFVLVFVVYGTVRPLPLFVAFILTMLLYFVPLARVRQA